MKVVGIIPARYASSRFHGKPLADICGKPMVWWVYKQAKKVSFFDEVYVATDDILISTQVEELGGKAILTSSKHPTGTDRVAEVAETIDADWYINIQGDEPLIEPETIEAILYPVQQGQCKDDVHVINLMAQIKDPVDAINPTIPKVIAGDDGRGIYLTRGTSPHPKGSIEYCYYKQLGVYAFTPSALSFFKDSPRGKIERIEDIEILRFIESGWHVKYVEVETQSIAVDTPKDLEKVRNIFINRRA